MIDMVRDKVSMFKGRHLLTRDCLKLGHYFRRFRKATLHRGLKRLSRSRRAKSPLLGLDSVQQAGRDLFFDGRDALSLAGASKLHAVEIALQRVVRVRASVAMCS